VRAQTLITDTIPQQKISLSFINLNSGNRVHVHARYAKKRYGRKAIEGSLKKGSRRHNELSIWDLEKQKSYFE
jgi:hypothetical protein